MAYRPIRGPNHRSDYKEDINFNDYPELLMEHPLSSPWSLWYLEQDRRKQWTDMQTEVCCFDSVEEFWSIYHCTKVPSELRTGCDYSLFRKGIRPMWEDDANQKGGRWVIILNKLNPGQVDKLWMEINLLLIGESFKYAHEIIGAVVNIRKTVDKVSIWTSDGWNRESCLSIGRQIYAGVKTKFSKMIYYLHKDTIVHGVDVITPLYTLDDILKQPYSK